MKGNSFYRLSRMILVKDVFMGYAHLDLGLTASRQRNTDDQRDKGEHEDYRVAPQIHMARRKIDIAKTT